MKRIAIVLLTLALVAGGFGVYAYMEGRTPTPWPQKEVVGNEKNEVLNVKPFKWNGVAVNCQFTGINFMEEVYTSTDIVVSQEKLSEDFGEMDLTNYDMCADVSLATTGQIYSMKDFATDLAIAVKLDGDDRIFVYVNIEYKPETLGQMMDTFKLHDMISFDKPLYYYKDEEEKEYQIQFENVDEAKIVETILEKENVQFVQLPEDSVTLIEMNANLSWAQEDDFKVVLTENGYVSFTMFGNEWSYEIGQEEMKNFTTYLVEECDGYELVFK